MSKIEKLQQQQNKMKNYDHLAVVRLCPFVTNVQLNRPQQRNALNGNLWQEIGDIFYFLSSDPDTRVVIISGNGRAFCAGLDLKDSQDIFQPPNAENGDDPARRSRRFREKIISYQRAFRAIEECPKPVIAAIHGACIGGGIDLITACDIRVAAAESTFCVKEVDIGMAADTGSLNRLIQICGNESWVREIALTARGFDETEALQHDLVSKVYDTREDMMKGVEKMAQIIAAKFPVVAEQLQAQLEESYFYFKTQRSLGIRHGAFEFLKQSKKVYDQKHYGFKCRVCDCYIYIPADDFDKAENDMEANIILRKGFYHDHA